MVKMMMKETCGRQRLELRRCFYSQLGPELENFCTAKTRLTGQRPGPGSKRRRPWRWCHYQILLSRNWSSIIGVCSAKT